MFWIVFYFFANFWEYWVALLFKLINSYYQMTFKSFLTCMSHLPYSFPFPFVCWLEVSVIIVSVFKIFNSNTMVPFVGIKAGVNTCFHCTYWKNIYISSYSWKKAIIWRKNAGISNFKRVDTMLKTFTFNYASRIF